MSSKKKDKKSETAAAKIPSDLKPEVKRLIEEAAEAKMKARLEAAEKRATEAEQKKAEAESKAADAEVKLAASPSSTSKTSDAAKTVVTSSAVS